MGVDELDLKSRAERIRTVIDPSRWRGKRGCHCRAASAKRSATVSGIWM
jgi:hypothetical protein